MPKNHAISLRQPFADECFDKLTDRKRIENREWNTNYRGRLHIHACGTHRTKKTGIIIGTVKLIDVIAKERDDRRYRGPNEILEMINTRYTTINEPLMTMEQLTKFMASRSRFYWILAKAKKLKTPIETKGSRRIWSF